MSWPPLIPVACSESAEEVLSKCFLGDGRKEVGSWSRGAERGGRDFNRRVASSDPKYWADLGKMFHWL